MDLLSKLSIHFLPRERREREKKRERESDPGWIIGNMSLLSDLINLNLSESTHKIIAEYVWWDFSPSMLRFSFLIHSLLFSTWNTFARATVCLASLVSDCLRRSHASVHCLWNLTSIWFFYRFTLFCIHLCLLLPIWCSQYFDLVKFLREKSWIWLNFQFFFTLIRLSLAKFVSFEVLMYILEWIWLCSYVICVRSE